MKTVRLTFVVLCIVGGSALGTTRTDSIASVIAPAVDSGAPVSLPASDFLRVSDSSDASQPLPQTTPHAQRPSPRTGPVSDSTDTTFTLVKRPHIGIGAGWALGGMPLFGVWNDGLPDSLYEFGFSQREPLMTFTGLPGDTQTVTVRHFVREKPNSYNVYFPIYLTFTPLTSEDRRLSLEGSFSFARKKFIAEVQVDTTRYKVFLEDALTSLWASLGATYARAVPEEYFSIDGVEKTMINLGLSVRPLQALFRSPNVRTTGEEDLGRATLEQTAQRLTHEFSAYGFGVGWRVGISALKKLSPHSALDIGLFYTGDWAGAYSVGGRSLRRADLNEGLAGGSPSFLSHMLEIRLLLLRGKKSE